MWILLWPYQIVQYYRISLLWDYFLLLLLNCFAKQLLGLGVSPIHFKALIAGYLMIPCHQWLLTETRLSMIAVSQVLSPSMNGETNPETSTSVGLEM